MACASDLMVVYYLEKNPEGLTGADLARLADVDRAAVSRTVTRLAADGFVEVGEESTRYRAPIRLTEKGYAAIWPRSTGSSRRSCGRRAAASWTSSAGRSTPRWSPSWGS